MPYIHADNQMSCSLIIPHEQFFRTYLLASLTGAGLANSESPRDFCTYLMDKPMNLFDIRIVHNILALFFISG